MNILSVQGFLLVQWKVLFPPAHVPPKSVLWSRYEGGTGHTQQGKQEKSLPLVEYWPCASQPLVAFILPGRLYFTWWILFSVFVFCFYFCNACFLYYCLIVDCGILTPVNTKWCKHIRRAGYLSESLKVHFVPLIPNHCCAGEGYFIRTTVLHNIGPGEVLVVVAVEVAYQ